ncbi:MAG: ribosome biogenesis/translation initiation ATPase RLI [Candidatus Nanoarchaeia archaeon]|nr:ribosome biogenesis/translation initiation ATPase RLI [Candidatus Nanoarchaeia archaeon]
MARVAILERLKCRNTKGCDFICGHYCPVNRTGQECIGINEKDKKPVIDEKLCTGCGICVRKCPVQCISIVNLPEKLKDDPIHRFGKNAFELFHLPIPKAGKVVGILGRNGIGKSTALNILAGILKPNLGNVSAQPKEEDIIEKYSNVSLGDYFRRLYSGNVKVAYKPQRIDLLPKQYEGTVKELLTKVDEKKIAFDLLNDLDASHLADRKISMLSGGELQKVAIIAAASKKAEVYYFDEPASFLDITTRIKAAKLIRSLADEKTAVLVVEHDLATLDYISDEIQIVYGEAGCYGVISQSKAVRRGINEYLDGFLPDDNVRFRDYAMRFFQYASERYASKETLLKFPGMEKKFETFKLKTTAGLVKKGEVLAVMGANGLGKTTFLKMLAGELIPDNGEIGKLKISYKVQYPSSDIGGTVKEALQKAGGLKYMSGWYRQTLLEKLGLGKLLDNEIKGLSGGELQKLYIAVTLLQDCTIYALDEPSAFIDVEDRLNVAEVIKDFVIKNEKCAIVVDHDVQFIDYIGDSMLVFEGKPGIEGHVFGPVTKTEGMNEVLKMLDITYRQDNETKRPRINKPGSQLDSEQRSKGRYYYTD